MIQGFRHTAPADDLEFICAICRRDVCLRWNFGGATKIIPPICNYCERNYTKGTARATSGTHRDRREATRILALAEALRCEAMSIEWRSKHAAA